MINIDETFKLTRGKGQKAQLYTILHLNKVKVVKTRANTTPKAKTGLTPFLEPLWELAFAAKTVKYGVK